MHVFGDVARSSTLLLYEIAICRTRWRFRIGQSSTVFKKMPYLIPSSKSGVTCVPETDPSGLSTNVYNEIQLFFKLGMMPLLTFRLFFLARNIFAIYQKYSIYQRTMLILIHKNSYKPWALISWWPTQDLVSSGRPLKRFISPSYGPARRRLWLRPPPTISILGTDYQKANMYLSDHIPQYGLYLCLSTPSSLWYSDLWQFSHPDFLMNTSQFCTAGGAVAASRRSPRSRGISLNWQHLLDSENDVENRATL